MPFFRAQRAVAVFVVRGGSQQLNVRYLGAGCELGPQVDREYDKVVAEVQAEIGEPATPPPLASTLT